MSEKLKEVEKMIAHIMKKQGVSKTAAIDYILIIGTGKILAQDRYKNSLPEGKASKGILAFASERARKKLAPKSRKLISKLADLESEPKPKPKPKRKPKPKAPKASKPEQTEMIVD